VHSTCHHIYAFVMLLIHHGAINAETLGIDDHHSTVHIAVTLAGIGVDGLTYESDQIAARHHD
jgi:hypothetical protein